MLKNKNSFLKASLVIFLNSWFLSSVVCAQEEKKVQSNEHEWLKNAHAFEALTFEKRKNYVKIKAKALELYKQQKLFTCLVKLYEAKSIFSKDFELHYWTGLCYSQLNLIDEAIAEYRSVLKVHPNDVAVNMNLFELLFFSKRYKECLSQSELLKALNAKKLIVNQQMPLLDFKILIALEKLSADNPGYQLKFERLSKKYNFMDDTPFSYFSDALKYSIKGDESELFNRINSGLFVFGNKRTLSWSKALKDAGYITGANYQSMIPQAPKENK